MLYATLERDVVGLTQTAVLDCISAVQMARQRSAPAALSIPADKAFVTPPVTPSSPQKSGFWGSPPCKSPTHRNPRKKPTRGSSQAAASRLGMKHVASEPQLNTLVTSDFEGSAKDIVEPLKLTAHTVPALQTLPDDTPPLSSAVTSPRELPVTAPASHSSSSSASHMAVPSRPNSISSSRGMLSPLGQSPPTPKPLDDSTAATIAKAVHTDDASLLNSVLPSLKSSMQSTTSLSTIAESNSSPDCSAQDLAALDQVAERLCELDRAELASKPSQTQLEHSNSGLKQLLKDQPGAAIEVSASSSSASLDRQPSGALARQTESTHDNSHRAEDSGNAATGAEASDVPASLSLVMPLYEHFPAHNPPSASREESTSTSDTDLHRASDASSGSFAGFEAARANVSAEPLCRASQESDPRHAGASSEASTPAFQQCNSGRHTSPFIAHKAEQQQQQGQQQQQEDAGHLVLPHEADRAASISTALSAGQALEESCQMNGPDLGRPSPR